MFLSPTQIQCAPVATIWIGPAVADVLLDETGAQIADESGNLLAVNEISTVSDGALLDETFAGLVDASGNPIGPEIGLGLANVVISQTQDDIDTDVFKLDWTDDGEARPSDGYNVEWWAPQIDGGEIEGSDSIGSLDPLHLSEPAIVAETLQARVQRVDSGIPGPWVNSAITHIDAA